MVLALLVYALGEWEVRRRLEEEGVPDQKGKSTARPTLRWEFPLFCEIRATPVTWLRLVVLEGRLAVLNLKPHHERVARLLGVERYCLLE